MNINCKKNDLQRILMLALIYIVLILNYHYVISNEFAYAVNGFKMYKLILSIIYTIVIILLSNTLKRGYYRLIYSIMLIMYYFGQSIFYIYNDCSIAPVFLMSIPLIGVLLADKLDGDRSFERITLNLQEPKTRIFILILAISTVAPFFKYINTVNLKNLLLIDIYDTRSLMRGYNQGILGYLFSPLSRVVFPFLLIYGLSNKRKSLAIVSFTGVVLLFLLNGAVKSVFLGLIGAIIFIKGDYIVKERYFLRMFQVVNITGLLSYGLFSNVLINDYMRRLVMVPADLFNIYFTYFKDNYTYYTHSRIYSILTNTPRGMPVGLYVGEHVMGREGLNANTGIFVEGFISFGIMGVIIASLIFMIIIIFLRKINFSPVYFGIVFVYIYIINTSFLEPLLLTHGLLFFLIFSFGFFTREPYMEKNKIYL